MSCLPGHALAYAGGAPVRLRIVFNRDERHTRQPGLPPELVACGSRLALMPRDRDGGGTWIAANDAGVGFALLNVNHTPHDERPAPAPYRTRGEVIERVVQSTTATEALD